MQPKKTIGNAAAAFIIGIALLLDGAKFLLLFVEAIPVVGTAFGMIASFGIAVVEIIAVYGSLWWLGAYRQKGGQVTKLGLTLIGSVIDLTPLIDALPATTLTVVGIVVKSRIQDKVNFRKAQQQAAMEAQKQAEQEARWERAEAAALRAQTRNTQG